MRWDTGGTHGASETLARSDERYRAALAAKLEPLVFLDAVRDIAGTIVDFVYSDANEAALSYLGLTLDELMATSLLTLAPRQRDSGLFEMYVRTVELGEDIVLDEAPIYSEILDRKAWLDFRGVRVADGLSLVWRDVTERVRAREALAYAEESYRLLAENASDVVLRATPDRVVDWISGSTWELFGRTPAEMLGLHDSDIFAPEDLAGVPRVQHVVPEGSTSGVRVRALQPDGSVRWLDRRSRTVLGADGCVQWYVTSLRDAAAEVAYQDVLEASQAQTLELAKRYGVARDEALAANLAKTVFLSRMSHELRTPLNAILGFAQLLAMDDLTEDQSGAVRQIRAGGKHLVGLIAEVMDLSRIDSGCISLSMESVSVADAVGEALDLVRALAERAGVSVGWAEGDGRTGQVWADRQRVIQILLNLVGNAVKYNRQGGSVVVSCEALADGMLAVHVRDTGYGLLPEQLARVFEPFDRLGAEQTAVEGTGIGLTLSRGLAHVMGGRLEVDSTPGEGSVFSLVLPASTAGPTDDIPVVTMASSPGGRETRVLSIEDNPTNTHLMARIVALRDSTELRTAPHGSAGLAAAAEERPDLVFLDLHLPDMPGEAVLTRLLELPTMDGVPVVVVTADATPGLGYRLKSLGADAVLTKPVDVDEVLAWIDHSTALRP